MCGHIGYLRDSDDQPCYALLNAVGENGDILATYDIPNAAAFRFIYRKLHLQFSVKGEWYFCTYFNAFSHD